MMVRIFHPSSLGAPSYFWTHRACFAQLWVPTWSFVRILALRSSWMPMNEPHTCMTSCPWTMWSCPLIVVPCPLTVVSCPRGTKLWPLGLTTYITSCLATTVSCPLGNKTMAFVGQGSEGRCFFFRFFWVLPPFLGGGWIGVATGYLHSFTSKETSRSKLSKLSNQQRPFGLSVWRIIKEGECGYGVKPIWSIYVDYSAWLTCSWLTIVILLIH
jgi:hypothetical protein